MRSKEKRTEIFSLAVFFLLFFFPIFSPAAWSKSIAVGSVSNSPRSEAQKFQAFTDYLARRLKPLGVEKGRVLIAGSMEEMAELLNQREVDLYIDSPFPVLKVEGVTGGIPFLRRWKKGVAEYSSVFFALEESGIDSLQDLKGKNIAFDEPFSSSGYFLPKATVLKEGIPLVYTALLADMPVPPLSIGYGFSYDEENAIVWVLRNKVSAAVTDKISFEKLSANSRQELKIIKETVLIPRQLVLHRKNLDPQLLEAVRTILVQMHENEEGRTVLKNFEKTARFDELQGDAAKSLESLRELVQFIKQEV